MAQPDSNELPRRERRLLWERIQDAIREAAATAAYAAEAIKQARRTVDQSQEIVQVVRECRKARHRAHAPPDEEE